MRYISLTFIWPKLLSSPLDILVPGVPPWNFTVFYVTSIKDIPSCFKTIDRDHHTAQLHLLCNCMLVPTSYMTSSILCFI